MWPADLHSLANDSSRLMETVRERRMRRCVVDADALLGEDALRASDLIEHAGSLGLDVERFRDDLRQHLGADRVAEDVDSADLSGVSGTPSFFVNGRRHYGAYDIDALSTAVRVARARALVTR